MNQKVSKFFRKFVDNCIHLSLNGLSSRIQLGGGKYSGAQWASFYSNHRSQFYQSQSSAREVFRLCDVSQNFFSQFWKLFHPQLKITYK